MDKGFVVLAQNTKNTDYVRCAEVLAYSVKHHMPNAKISLITDDITNSKYFDNVIPLPYGDQDKDGDWKLINDWQVYEASPYEYTIKLEADLFFPCNVDYWWDVLKYKDIVVSSTIRDFKQDISHQRWYRRLLDDNKLPDVYNALTYFKKSEVAEKFFQLVRLIFENWSDVRSTLRCDKNEPATTDWVYAMAADIIGRDKVIMPEYTQFSMVHMKQHINGLPVENWTDILIYEVLPYTLRINTVPQQYPFHYHIKTFCNKLENCYE